MVSNLLNFDFSAPPAQEHRSAGLSTESAIDLVTAEMLSFEKSEKSLKNVRLLIIVEKAHYRAYTSSLLAVQTPSEHTAQPISYADAQMLNSASAWHRQAQAVAIFSCYSETAYSEICSLGIRLMGSGLSSEAALRGESASQSRQNEQKMLRLVADFCPTHIVLSTPNYRLLKWANRNHIRSVALLQKWPELLNRQQRQQHKSLLKQLNNPHVSWVGAQGISACKVMASRFSDKLIPWDWPRPSIPSQYAPKPLNGNRDRIHLFYAGSLDRSSGIGDLLAAVSELKQRSRPVALQIAVDETTPPFALDALFAQSQQLNIAEAIAFSLPESIEQLLSQVRAADVLIIPGDLPDHESGAELPIIVQAAIAACTPIVACDRADLSSYLSHGINAMIFPEGNAKAMVHRIERLMGQPQLYRQLSEAGIAQQRVNGPAVWQDLIERWMYDSPADRQWLRNYAFSSGRYPKPEGCIP